MSGQSRCPTKLTLTLTSIHVSHNKQPSTVSDYHDDCTHKELFYPVGAANFSRSFFRIDFNINIDTSDVPPTRKRLPAQSRFSNAARAMTFY